MVIKLNQEYERKIDKATREAKCLEGVVLEKLHEIGGNCTKGTCYVS